MAHDIQIVCDDEESDAERRLELVQEVQHFTLHRDVEAGGRLVRDEELWPQRQRARDADAARLTAGKLVRIALQEGRGQPDLVEQALTLPSTPSASW